ncbi:hypothetical protein GOP47_0002359 [Adiantum capillus-veneris]|uniref:Uncharacterized protein n=1 Tax=Adiantum capillus-veneris TaxID=13818 RepID=A0A9D4ZQW9_ADICA|nr:hypothetical protein GOP47_0002359 [Adiantum capillus-veneris]
MASQPVMEAAARESRANAREDMAVLTSGAREKVDTTMASMQALGRKILHPQDKTKKDEVQAASEQQKKEAREKRDEIRSIAAQQAAAERVAARSMVAKGVAEGGGTRYPVLTTDQPASTQHAWDPNYSANQPQQVTSIPQASDPEYQASRPPLSEEPHGPLEAIHVGRPHDQRPVVGDPDTSTEAPAPVAPPSRLDRSGEQDRCQGEKVDEEGAEDADFYPPTRIVQT